MVAGRQLTRIEPDDYFALLAPRWLQDANWSEWHPVQHHRAFRGQVLGRQG